MIWYGAGRLWHAVRPIQITEAGISDTKHSTSERNTLRVAAYNIAHGRGGTLGQTNWIHKKPEQVIEQLKKISRQIIQESPDIIVLNEIDFNAKWSFGIDQAQFLAEECGYRYVLKQKNFNVSLPFYNLSFGNALLSRHPIENPQFLNFSAYSKYEALLAGDHDGFICDIHTPLGAVSFAGIHLEYRDEPTRIAAAQLFDVALSNRPHPLIALGDFNSTLSANTNTAMNLLFSKLNYTSAGHSLEPGQPFTFPASNPKIQIDWIIGKGELKFTNFRAVPSSHSDHLMVIAEVAL
ncbi:MAG: endonuclease/exonuclease/phosphatase family protein [Verrucomicrobiota bacterium]